MLFKEERIVNFLKNLFGKKTPSHEEKLDARRKEIARSTYAPTSTAQSNSYASRSSDDVFSNPLHPLSPINPISPLNLYSHTSSISHSECSGSSSSSSSDSSSYSSSDSGSSSSSCD